MAFSTILRRASTLTVRAIKSQRNYHSAIFTPLKNSSSQQLCGRTLLPTLQFSSLAKKPSTDQTLLRILDTEIECAVEDLDSVEIKSGFPFEIQDNPGLQTISLSREHQGEVIKVEVTPAFDEDEDDSDEEEDKDNNDGDGDKDKDCGDDDENSEEGGKLSIHLNICVCKGDGPCLEFGCTAYPDEVVIDSVAVKKQDASEDGLAYEGPEFSCLDESLQKAFNKYLEIRGVRPSVTNKLLEYMINKDSKEYLIWLKKIKNFVAK